jgi:hypothetical protein
VEDYASHNTWSRSLKIGEIYEIMLTDSTISPGEALTELRVISFFDVTQRGHSSIGDKLYLDGVLWV